MNLNRDLVQWSIKRNHDRDTLNYPKMESLFYGLEISGQIEKIIIMKKNNGFYQKNAREFFDSTIHVNMQSLRQQFLMYIPVGGSILDAGCGSGRDAKSFLELEYQVTCFDSAPALAKLAEEYLSHPVNVLRFQDMNYVNEFDGIWACASLLHVPQNKLPEIFLKLFRALKQGGVLYASFKYGSGEVENNGRYFTNMNEHDFSNLLMRINVFKTIDIWVSDDRRPDRVNEFWFNALLKSAEDSWHSA